MYKMKIYPDSMTQKLIRTLGLEEVNTTWQQYGMYKGSEQLSKKMQAYVSPFVLRYMSNKYNFGMRTISRDLPIAKGILRKSVPEGFYKHIIIEQQNE